MKVILQSEKDGHIFRLIEFSINNYHVYYSRGYWIKERYKFFSLKDARNFYLKLSIEKSHKRA